MVQSMREAFESNYKHSNWALDYSTALDIDFIDLLELVRPNLEISMEMSKRVHASKQLAKSYILERINIYISLIKPKPDFEEIMRLLKEFVIRNRNYRKIIYFNIADEISHAISEAKISAKEMLCHCLDIIQISCYYGDSMLVHLYRIMIQNFFLLKPGKTDVMCLFESLIGTEKGIVLKYIDIDEIKCCKMPGPIEIFAFPQKDWQPVFL
ncbi:hypothetical protein ENBRE01_1006 [Enteropsectra breve]|nr:hypothetical protein ENBRE01_1006 [Enteropsectra breve]